MHHLRAVAVVLLLLATLPGCGKTHVPHAVRWHDDLDAGATLARAQGKLHFVYVGASWDAAAKELESITFVDPVVVALLDRHYIATHLDVSDDEDDRVGVLSRRLAMVGEPLLVVFDVEGKELVRFNQFMPPDKLAPMLAAAAKRDGGHAFHRALTEQRREEAARLALWAAEAESYEQRQREATRPPGAR